MAFGAQNLFVLESGLKKDNHFIVAFICTFCDLVLIMLGLLGVTFLFDQYPFLKIGFSFVGFLFLAYTGFQKILVRPAPNNDNIKYNALKSPRKNTILKTLAFSLLNPHVYIDTVLIIGGTGARIENFIEKLLFGLGASFFSCLWFFCLSFLSSQIKIMGGKSYFFVNISRFSGVLLIAFSIKMLLEAF